MATDTIKFMPNTAILVTDNADNVLGILTEKEDDTGYQNTLEQMIGVHTCCDTAIIITEINFVMNDKDYKRVHARIIWEDEPEYKESFILKTVQLF